MNIPLGHHHHTYSDIRLCMLMIGEHGVKIHAIDMVARKNNYLVCRVVFHKINVLPDSIGSAFIPVRVLFTGTWRQNFDAAGAASEVPGFAAADMGHQRKRLVLGQHSHLGQA